MANKPVLLLIDIQNDYFPGGRMELVGADQSARNASEILQHFRKNGLPVVHIAHESVHEGASFFLPGSEGQRIHNLVLPLDGEIVVIKNFPNSFLKTPLLELLQSLQVGHLFISGMMTHMCIDATVRAAKDLGFVCSLIHDATATKDLSFAGEQVLAAKVQAAFTAALGNICDTVQSTRNVLQSLAV